MNFFYHYYSDGKVNQQLDFHDGLSLWSMPLFLACARSSHVSHTRVSSLPEKNMRVTKDLLYSLYVASPTNLLVLFEGLRRASSRETFHDLY